MKMFTLLYGILLLLLGVFHQPSYNDVTFPFVPTTSSLFAAGLFLNEHFKYKDVDMTLDSSFNITLIRIGTIPRKLRINSMCQIPDQQFAKIVDEPSPNSTKRTTHATRDDVQCDTGKFCSGLKAFGYCLGSSHEYVKASCVQALFNKIDALQQDALKAALDQALKYTDSSVHAAFNGIAQSLTATINTMGDTLTSSITKSETALMTAVMDSNAVVTQSLNSNIQSLASAANKTIQALQGDINKQFNKADTSLHTLGTALFSITRSLEKGILDTSVASYQRVTSLQSYLNTVITLINSNSLNQQKSLMSILESIQQLTVRAEKNSRFEFEGVDISSLLSAWRLSNQSGVFMSPTNNTYKYVATGLVGIYDKGMIDIQYPYENDVVGRYAITCWEKGAAPSPTYAPTQTSTVTYMLQDCNLNATLYDIACNKIESYCGTSNIRSIFDNYLRNSRFPYIRVAQEVLGGPITFAFCDNSNPSCTNSPYSFLLGPNTCQFPSVGVPPTYTKLPPDQKAFANTNRYVTLVTSSTDSPLFSVTADTASFTYYMTTTIDALSVPIAATCTTASYAYTFTQQSVQTTLYGKNQFFINHPTQGIMNMHMCTPASTSGYQSITDWNHPDASAYGFAVAGGDSKILAGGYQGVLPGKQTISSFGLGVKTVDLLVRQVAVGPESIEGMEPDPYYYTQDIWCCDVDSNLPKLTVNKESDCLALNITVCSSALFGNCTQGNNGIQVRKLYRASPVSQYLCPLGYNSKPLSTLTMYKSPRMYYCSEGRRFREPYGVELAFCDAGEVALPGAGVSLETGIMAPGGLYPAACIFWNSVQDQVPLYKISTSFEKKVVPIKITTLHNRKLAFYYSTVDVVDEMDRLYGQENSGYDCVTYEMDRLLHTPSNCPSFDIPVYNAQAYFSSRVRSSGISNLLEYFDIVPIPLTDGSNNLVINFALRAGIDYEAALVDNNSSCPNLQVNYVGNSCLLSGWSTLPSSNIVMVANQAVCNVSCIASIRVADQTELNVAVISPTGVVTECSKFKCLASSKLFVAYPVDAFNMLVARPNEALFFPSSAPLITNLNDILGTMTNNVQSSLANLSQYLSQNHGSYVPVNLTIDIELASPNMTETVTNYQINSKKAAIALNESVSDLTATLNSGVVALQQSINDSMRQEYAQVVAGLNNFFAYYQAKNVPGGGNGGQSSYVPPDQQPTNAFIAFLADAAFTVTNIKIMAIATLCISAYNLALCAWIFRRTLFYLVRLTIGCCTGIPPGVPPPAPPY